MVVEEKDFRASLQTLVRGGLVIIVLTILKALAGVIPGTDTVVGRLSVGNYVSLAISLFIIGALIRLFKPLKTVLTFYLATIVKVGKIAGRDQYLDHLLAVAEQLTMLIFLIIMYQYCVPVLITLNFAFIRFNELKTLVDIGCVLFGLYIIAMLWKNAQPLVEIFTSKITDKVAGASSKVAYVKCAACGAQNDIDAGFCVSCGATMSKASAESKATSLHCAKCGNENAVAAKFCQKCGSPLK